MARTDNTVRYKETREHRKIPIGKDDVFIRFDMNSFFITYMHVISELCQKYKVNKLFAFGSVLTGRFNAESDIDFVVDFKDIDLSDYADNYLDLRDALAKTFGHEVDLLEDKAIRNPILRRNIDKSKQLIYG